MIETGKKSVEDIATKTENANVAVSQTEGSKMLTATNGIDVKYAIVFVAQKVVSKVTSSSSGGSAAPTPPSQGADPSELAFQLITQKLQQSVQSGGFTKSLQAAAKANNVTVLQKVVSSTTVTTTAPVTVVAKQSRFPTSQPSSRPSNSPPGTPLPDSIVAIIAALCSFTVVAVAGVVVHSFFYEEVRPTLYCSLLYCSVLYCSVYCTVYNLHP